MLWPNWFHFRKAPFLKGGIDYRKSFGKILLYDNFQSNGYYVDNPQKFFLKRKDNKTINWFSGDENFFADLYEHHELIRDELRSIASKNVLKNLAKIQDAKIILNIRRGKDFKDAQSAKDFTTKGAIRTPLNWFINTLKQIREVAGKDIPALIISDGNATDLKEILSLPNIALANTSSALADLLLLSKAKIILGSGGSSFTAWGSFLSKAITLTIPGQSLQWFKVSKDINQHLVDVYSPESPNEEHLDKIKKIIFSELSE
ncbi:hypothetical protein [Pedobacter helvus]|uniref:Uncharacterized protein n=1 Tax=Pedobacter helvus TaxID=2563444 RepID=A0ABW9JPF8_9SPHI|nr:hypothetical protein [Pedobacter ureilyticus]